MPGFISAISDKFGKVLILGTFFPSALVTILAWLLLVPLFPTDWSFLKPVQSLGTEWQLLVFGLITILLSGLLSNLNIALLRWYEGYPWQHTWIGNSRRKAQTNKFNNLVAERVTLRTLDDFLGQFDDEGHKEKKSEVYERRSIVARTINLEYPFKPELILPTRLGNIVRSFESYADRQYGMDPITLWPRLLAKINGDYAANIGDAKSSYDFMLNSCTLCWLLAIAMLGVGLGFGTAAASPGWIVWGAEIVGLLILAAIFHQGSYGRALAWGDQVRGAFDLYRWDLLEALHYTPAPTDVDAEKAMWDAISRQILYGYPPAGRGKPLHYSPTDKPATSVRCAEPKITLEVTRGMKRLDNDCLQVSVLVANCEDVADATHVVVVERLMPDTAYVFGSAHLEHEVGNSIVTVKGTDPYDFELGTIAHRSSLTLTYQLLILGAPHDAPVQASNNS